MRSAPLPRRRTLLGAAAMAATTAALPSAAAHAAGADRTDREHGADATAGLPSDAEVAEQVRAEYLHGWEGYKRVAWGYDEARPVSGGRDDFFAKGHTFGLSIVEALDTLWLMEQDEEVRLAADWIEEHLDPVVDAEIQVFEAVIRLVGGLLAGYLCTGRTKLLDRCRELADRLLPAFTRSPSHLPYRYVNLRTGAVSGSVSPLAEVGTNAVEFGLLSRLTGDGRYWSAAKRAARAVVTRRSSLDLLGTELDIESGRWTDTHAIEPNPPVDSFYEYLWDGGELLDDADLRGWYRMLTDAVLKYQAERRDGALWFRQVDFGTGKTTGHDQSELASFYAGLLGKGGDLAAGRDYYRSWTGLLDRYQLLPEVVDYASGQVRSARNDLRPEYANSAFDLWRLTGADEYRQTAYRYFQAVRARHKVPGGYTVAEDVTTSPVRLGDLMPGYWFAENLKYLYLMFAAAPRFDYRTGLLSTEGKLVRGAVRS
ncbi:glycoside hydrolase family 47 protein [Kitasatospora sp. HPMI-4]|uniref:glycoside hydrolase family 47 protein n=1 Tax=Kitasatospora sp. HPMI-4 TaxID=3448443 RepID=UPI003F1C2D93